MSAGTKTNGWKKVEIGEVTLPTKNDDPTKRPSEKFFYVDVSSVCNEHFRIREPKFLLGADAPSRARKKIQKGDVLFATVRPTLQRIALVPKKYDQQIASTGYCVLRPNNELVRSDFLYYSLLTDAFKAEMKSVQRGANYPAVRDSDVKRSELGLPPKAEQQKIAYVLSVVQRAMEQQERLIQTTTELKKALMQKLFTEGTRGEPQKQTEIGPVPKSWTVDRFDSFAVLQRGFDITKKQQRPGNVPVVSSGGIGSYHDESKVAGPGVVIGRKGSLGTVHYIEEDYWPHDTTLWVKDFKGHDPRFASYFLDSLDLKRFDSGAANPTLNRNTVHAEHVAFPPEDEQTEIGKHLLAVEKKVAVHARKLKTLGDLFKTLLHKLMTAEIRVHDIDLPGFKEFEIANGR